MVLVVFVRHGQSESNVNKILSHDVHSYPLTEEGKEQSKRTARELRKLKVGKIFTSPVLRAYQTATIIGNELGLIPIIDDRLKERHLGDLNNKRFDPNSHWKLKLIRGEIEVKDLEPWESMKRRMTDFLNSVPESDSVVVAVSHYDPIRALIGHILDLDDISAYGISLPNASMTVIEHERDKGSLYIHSLGSPVISSTLLSKLNRYIISTNI
ncbi:MAG: phosphoglycerate mutase [Candidatus Aramenus sulfurataquae]|jgi:probable phosphoglycerate mutase|uniref:Phosphoglycerate mutase n=2 Tax=Candidatus Aramenus sulfurataquae TaxID=1326980 RepID=W7KW31_9CREN|nr:MAG: phosphoglycerate mutase [Candidatus Aramenus sulfurataquae]MCL7343706.1 2,3-diphosphoglycerate-dependent phosphoglycerate mutase [Candidatus Aramenus sulfurataquae]